MGGIGGKGKGARRREKLKDNAKSFDKKTGTFREPKLELVDGKVSKQDMLKAPSSFLRCMEATRRAKEQAARRERQYNKSQGIDVSDDEVDDPLVNAPDVGTGAKAKSKNDAENESDKDTGDDDALTWLRPDVGGEEEPDELDAAAELRKKRKKRAGDEDGANVKKKYQSLRERKSAARKAMKAMKDEDESFIFGKTSEARVEKSRGGDVSFWEVADAPPTITLKRKSGGKGAKPVPVAESGHKIAGSKGAGNRQAQIFQSLMRKSAKDGGGQKAPPGVGLRRVAEMTALREQVISGYRQMKGRPSNNGRSASLATDPSRLFSAVGGATIRRDAGK